MKNKKYVRSFILLIVLLSMFLMTTYALLVASLTIYNNTFVTGEVKINFNDSKKVFDETDFRLSPGSSISKRMTIQNIGTGAVYYRLYMENVSGDLNDRLIFRIYGDNRLLKQTKASEFTRDNALIFDAPLEVNQTVTYVMEAYLPEDTENVYQNGVLHFDLIANAIQTKNNPNGIFE